MNFRDVCNSKNNHFNSEAIFGVLIDALETRQFEVRTKKPFYLQAFRYVMFYTPEI